MSEEFKNSNHVWSQEFTLKNIERARRYLIEEMNQNELISKKHKNVFTTLNYFE